MTTLQPQPGVCGVDRVDIVDKDKLLQRVSSEWWTMDGRFRERVTLEMLFTQRLARTIALQLRETLFYWERGQRITQRLSGCLYCACHIFDGTASSRASAAH